MYRPYLANGYRHVARRGDLVESSADASRSSGYADARANEEFRSWKLTFSTALPVHGDAAHRYRTKRGHC